MERRNPVQVLAKVAELLDVLAEEQDVSAGRLAELVGEPRSTIYRLLASLQGLDMVEPGSKRGTYRLGLKLLRLGSAVVARFDARQAALPVMERLHEATEETVYLCIRRGNEAVCIERLDGRWVQSMALRLGGSLPLHAGAAPRVLLAYEPRDVWEEYVNTVPLRAFTDSTPSSWTALYGALEEVLDTGCSVSEGDVSLGIAALGAPIFDHHGKVVAALSISGPQPTILGENAETNTLLIVEAAAEISHSLGFVRDAEPVH